MSISYIGADVDCTMTEVAIEKNGEGKKDALRVNFDRKLKLEFHGVKVTSETGLLTFRDRFDILMEIRLSDVAKRLIWEL